MEPNGPAETVPAKSSAPGGKSPKKWWPIVKWVLLVIFFPVIPIYLWRKRKLKGVVAGIAAVVLAFFWAGIAAAGSSDPDTKEPAKVVEVVPSATLTPALTPTPTPTASPTPTETPTPSPSKIVLDEADYLGHTQSSAVTALTGLGLVVTTEEIVNDGTQVANTVAHLLVTGALIAGSEVTVQYYGAKPTPTLTKTTAPQPSVRVTQATNCNPNYDGCLPIVGDLDCPDIGHVVHVLGSDPYRLDSDHDGTGCESYG